MPKYWWKLPSTNNFVNTIISNVKQGKNNIIWFPEKIDSNYKYIYDALKSHQADYICERLSVCSDDPMGYLIDYFKISTFSKNERSIKRLLTDKHLEGKILFILLENSNIKQWIDFVFRCQHELQNIEPALRCLIVLPVSGILINDLPQSDTCLAVQKFQNVLNDLDLELFFLSRSSSTKFKNDLIKKTYISMLVQLASDDLDFAIYLLEQQPEDIFEPIAILQKFANIRNWTSFKYRDLRDLSTKELDFFTSKGILFKKENLNYYHSAFLALHKRISEIEQRIWIAQIKILFPFVEIFRHQLLKKLNGILIIPYSKKIGNVSVMISEANDLELGDIKYQLTSRSDVNFHIGKNLLRLIYLLKEIRDKMSHIKIVGFEQMNNELLNSINETIYD